MKKLLEEYLESETKGLKRVMVAYESIATGFTVHFYDGTQQVTHAELYTFLFNRIKKLEDQYVAPRI